MPSSTSQHACGYQAPRRHLSVCSYRRRPCLLGLHPCLLLPLPVVPGVVLLVVHPRVFLQGSPGALKKINKWLENNNFPSVKTHGCRSRGDSGHCSSAMNCQKKCSLESGLVFYLLSGNMSLLSSWFYIATK